MRSINNSYKLLVVDIDGTLVGSDGIISAENRAALDSVRQSGILVALSTGRAIQACREIISQLALDGYHIFFDGALAGNPEQDREIYVKLLDKASIKQAIEYTHRHSLDLEFYSTTGYFAERETWSTEAHRQFFNVTPTIVGFDDLWQRQRIIKGGLVVTSPQEVARARDFCTHFDDRFHFTWVRTPAYPGVDFINIVDHGVSKGNALAALASHLGISMSEIVAVGDGMNDITLLSNAGLAIAMQDAPDEVKAVANHITIGVDQNGLAAAINRFLL